MIYHFQSKLIIPVKITSTLHFCQKYGSRKDVKSNPTPKTAYPQPRFRWHIDTALNFMQTTPIRMMKFQLPISSKLVRVELHTGSMFHSTRKRICVKGKLSLNFHISNHKKTVFMSIIIYHIPENYTIRIQANQIPQLVKCQQKHMVTIKHLNNSS